MSYYKSVDELCANCGRPPGEHRQYRDSRPPHCPKPLSRDQALSAPAAESGKDPSPSPVAVGAAPAQAHDPSAGDGAGDPEPAPVAEAPERVTHEGARKAVRSGFMPKLLLEYIDQQEQLEREVASLRDDHREYMVKAGNEYSKVLAERDALRAKLSESERKLGELTAQLVRLTDMRDCDVEECMQQPTHLLCDKHAPPAAKEPTGGEPAKADFCGACNRLSCVCKNHDHDSFLMGSPADCPLCAKQKELVVPIAPTAEAEPRFRVGQRVKWLLSGRIFNIRESQLPWVNREWSDFELVEPADPAPPRPGRDRPVMVSELVRALRVAARWSNDAGYGRAADELEREGAEKP